MIFYREGGINIPKHLLTKEQLHLIRYELTVEPSNYSGFVMNNNNGNSIFHVYLESDTDIIIPPRCDEIFKQFNITLPIDIFQITSSIQKMNSSIKFNGELKSKQIESCNALLQALNNPKKQSGILSVSCGGGKTVQSLYLAVKLGYKTLVLVHQEHLANQWKERIQTFITNVRIGTIQRDIIDTVDCDIVIGMIQSVSMKKYLPGLFNDFGLLICDECHHLGAEVFSKCLQKIPAPYRIGLSATPQRKDGLTKVFQWYLGDIEYQSERLNLENCVSIIKCNFLSEEKKMYLDVRMIRMAGGRKTVNLPALITQICDFEARNDFIIEKMKPYIIEKDRYILLLTDRREHINHLYKKLQFLCTEYKKSVGKYCGGMKPIELQETLKCDIILATYQMASEGFDCSKLNTLILSTPKADIEQSVGRILRKKHDVNKLPIILDIIDENIPTLKTQYTKRLTYYKKCGYIVDGVKLVMPIKKKLIPTEEKEEEYCLV